LRERNFQTAIIKNEVAKNGGFRDWVLIISIAVLSSPEALPIVLVPEMGVDLMHWYQRGQDDASFLIPIVLTVYILDTLKSVPDQRRGILDNPAGACYILAHGTVRVRSAAALFSHPCYS
jgi:hypothetical protein